MSSGATTAAADEAVFAQQLVSAGDWTLSKVGIAGTKAVLEVQSGYGGHPRRPLQPYTGDLQALVNSLEGLLQLEAQLALTPTAAEEST